VERLGHQLLARSRLTIDEHRRVQPGHVPDAALEGQHGRVFREHPVQGGQAAALPATDHPLVNGVVLGRVHHALHPAVHHDGDGGGLQQHPLPPVVVDVLENVVAGPARPQGGKDGAALPVQLRIELQNVPPHRVLGAPVAVQRNPVVFDDPLPVDHQNSVCILAEAEYLANLIQKPLQHACSPLLFMRI